MKEKLTKNVYRQRKKEEIVVAAAAVAAVVAAVVAAAAVGLLKPMRNNLQQQPHDDDPYLHDRQDYRPWQQQPLPPPSNYSVHRGTDGADRVAEPSKRRKKIRHQSVHEFQPLSLRLFRTSPKHNLPL